MTRSASPEQPQAHAEWQQAQWQRTEWQSAVDEAEAWLMIDVAMRSGLVQYGGKINAARCREILEQGQQQGIELRPDALGDLLHTLKACYDFRAKPEFSAVDGHG